MLDTRHTRRDNYIMKTTHELKTNRDGMIELHVNGAKFETFSNRADAEKATAKLIATMKRIAKADREIAKLAKL